MKNLEEIDEDLLEGAEELAKMSDKELMALSLGSNERKGENYQMGVNLKLKSSVNKLNENINLLRKSTNISSWIMGIMTLFILILTTVLVWKEF